MPKSKSPKKDGAPVFEVDPDAKERAIKGQASRSKNKDSIWDRYAYHIVCGVFGIAMVICIVSALWKGGPDIHKTDVNDMAYIQSINSQGLSFQVGNISMFEGYKLVDVKYLIANQASNKKQMYNCNPGNEEVIVPDSYDFRKAYPKCFREPVSQGNCSSSYSLAAVSAITDRWCRSNQDKFPFFSGNFPVACDKAINSNCKGGFVTRTLDYAKIYGLVDQDCYPDEGEITDSPTECLEKTTDYCVSSEEQNIKQQIYNHGPLIVVIPVYRDFLIYKKGLYQVYPKNKKYSSHHAVKLIGWDVIDGHKCWLIQNTWGSDWGQNGVGCIMANQDEFPIERFTLAAALKIEEIEGNKPNIEEEKINLDEDLQFEHQETVETQEL